MKKRWLVIIIVAVFMFTSFQITTAETKVDELKIGISRDEFTINPYTYNTGYPGVDMMQLVYDTMFQLDEDLIPQPWLVKDYDLSDDGLTYNFTLHEGIEWHDGEPLTAEDIEFTVEYYREYPKSRFTDPLRVIESIDVHDDTSLTFHLSDPAPNFEMGPLSDVPILPKHVWSDITNPDEESGQSIGSGPYVFEEHRTDQFIKVSANPNYFHGEPAVNSIVFPIIPDTTALYTALRSGDLDAIAPSLTPELVEQFDNSPDIKVIQGPGFGSTIFHMNASQYPITETEFRQAIKYAIDPQYLVDTVLLGFGEVARPGWVHPAATYFNDAVPPHETDIEKAKQILEDAGFVDTNGDGFREDQNGERIELKNIVPSNNPVRIRTGEIITEWLNDVGIRVEVQALDQETAVQLMWPDFDVSQGRDFDFGMFGWSAPVQSTPDRMIELFHTDPAFANLNLGGYSSSEFDQLADDLMSAIDPDERLNIAYEMQEFVAEEYPIATLFFVDIINAYNPDVYDGYTFQAGKGIIHKGSFITSETDSSEGTESASDETESSNDESEEEVSSSDVETEQASEGTEGSSNNVLFYLIGFIVLVAGVGFYLKKKAQSGDNAA